MGEEYKCNGKCGKACKCKERAQGKGLKKAE
jgi:hypothetical protein